MWTAASKLAVWNACSQTAVTVTEGVADQGGATPVLLAETPRTSGCSFPPTVL